MRKNSKCYSAKLEGPNINMSFALYKHTLSQDKRFQALVVSVHGFPWRCLKTGGELTDGQSNKVAKGSPHRKEAYLAGGEQYSSQREEAMGLCQDHS